MITCLAIAFQLHANAQFQLLGSGSQAQLQPDEYRLTADEAWQWGALWHPFKLDLSTPFQLDFELYFGSSDEGADGIVFALQDQCLNAGASGGNIGVGGVKPSLNVEFDTFSNGSWWGEEFIGDHIAMSRDGYLNHVVDSTVLFHGYNGVLKTPVSARSDNGNIEDGAYHSVRINWNPDNQAMTVYFDDLSQPRLSYSGDIVNDIFNGNPFVYWGFTSATGGAHNEHRVRIAPQELTDYSLEICVGGSQYLAIDGIHSATQFEWQPTVGVSDPFSPMVTLSPEQSTRYTLAISDDQCGVELTTEVYVEVQPIPSPTIEVQDPLCSADYGTATIEVDEPMTFLWEDGVEAHSRSDLEGGTYWVTGTFMQCTTTHEVNVKAPEPISITLDITRDTCTSEALVQTVSQGGTGRHTYVWSDGERHLDGQFTSGNYILTVVDSHNCSMQTEIELPVIERIEPRISFSDTLLLIDESVSISIELGDFNQWEWRLNDQVYYESEVFASFSQPGIHSVDLVTEDVYGCVDSTSAFLKVQNVVDVYVPNAFHPNNDGLNDDWKPTFSADPVKYQLEVFDRWGELVFESAQASQGWNGISASSGVYNYRLSYSTLQDPRITLYGKISLIR
jgi:gliding motility-associated-like protein